MKPDETKESEKKIMNREKQLRKVMKEAKGRQKKVAEKINKEN